MRKYSAVMKAGLASAMEQRFDFFAGLFSTIFPIIIQVFLWMAIYAGSLEPLYGYTFAQMMLYVVMAGAISLFVNTGVEDRVNSDIHSGALGIYLCRPVNYFAYRAFHTLGLRLPATAITLLFTAAMLLVMRLFLGLQTGVTIILLFLVALALGVSLNFCLFYLISLLGMWLTEVGNFFMTIRVVIMVISGGVFPITVLGDTFVNVMKFLPFMYTTYFPISVVTGALPLEEILVSYGFQTLWIGMLGVLIRLVWRRGMRQYVNVGG